MCTFEQRQIAWPVVQKLGRSENERLETRKSRGKCMRINLWKCTFISH